MSNEITPWDLFAAAALQAAANSTAARNIPHSYLINTASDIADEMCRRSEAHRRKEMEDAHPRAGTWQEARLEPEPPEDLP